MPTRIGAHQTFFYFFICWDPNDREYGKTRSIGSVGFGSFLHVRSIGYLFLPLTDFSVSLFRTQGYDPKLRGRFEKSVSEALPSPSAKHLPRLRPVPRPSAARFLQGAREVLVLRETGIAATYPKWILRKASAAPPCFILPRGI